MTMDTAITQQTYDMQLRTLLFDVAHRIVQSIVLEESTIGDGIVDQRNVLNDDEASPQVQVSNLRVAHLSHRKTNILFCRPDQCPWTCSAPVVDIGYFGELDTVAFCLLALAPTVEDGEHNRTWSFVLSHIHS